MVTEAEKDCPVVSEEGADIEEQDALLVGAIATQEEPFQTGELAKLQLPQQRDWFGSTVTASDEFALPHVNPTLQPLEGGVTGAEPLGFELLAE